MKLNSCEDFGCTKIFHCNLPKDSPVIDVIGAVDELQSALDMARVNSKYSQIIEDIQTKLRFLAGEIAGYSTEEQKISLNDVSMVEQLIEKLADVVPSSFVRFNKVNSIMLNEARVRTRSLERKITSLSLRQELGKYVNRVSDLLFVLSYRTEIDG